MSDEAERRRRRPMERIRDLLPATAHRLGLDDELRLARAVASWELLVAERIPAAAGACRLIGLQGREVAVEADHPIVGQELRMREPELLAALAGALGDPAPTRLRVTVRRG